MHPPLLQQAPSRHDRPTAAGSSFRTHDHRTRQIGALSSGLSGHRPLNLLWRHPVLLRTSGDHGQSVGLPGTPRRPDGSTEGRERTRSAVPQAPPPVNDASQKHHGTAGSTHQGTLGAQDGLARASTMGAGTAIDSVAHGGCVPFRYCGPPGSTRTRIAPRSTESAGAGLADRRIMPLSPL
jgi:hypothetical protein